jgi:hypothetical protein
MPFSLNALPFLSIVRRRGSNTIVHSGWMLNNTRTRFFRAIIAANLRQF